jgi:hypothetical protein
MKGHCLLPSVAILAASEGACGVTAIFGDRERGPLFALAKPIYYRGAQFVEGTQWPPR